MQAVNGHTDKLRGLNSLDGNAWTALARARIAEGIAYGGKQNLLQGKEESSE